jgi:hypothetical protein
MTPLYARARCEQAIDGGSLMLRSMEEDKPFLWW